MKNSNHGILSGIRIIELGNTRAVSLTGMFLAQQGAEVVKIADLRPSHENDAVHTICNRNKKLLHLHVADPADREKLDQLLKCADIFISPFTEQVLKEYGINYSVGQYKDNPRLICCSLPGYPSTEAAHDHEVTEEEIHISSGMYETPAGFGKPSYFPFPLASTYTALHAVNAVTMALIGRKRNGCGQHIEIPVVNAGKTLQIISYMIKSKPPTCWSAFQMLSSPFMGIWKTAKNSHVYLHIGIPMHLRSFIMLLGKAGFGREKVALKKVISKETKRDPSMVKTVKESIGITRVLKRLLLKKDAWYWEDLLCNAGLCCNRIADLDEWLLHPQAIESGEVVHIDDEKGERINAPGPLLYLKKNNGVADQSEKGETTPLAIVEKWRCRASNDAPSGSNSLPLQGVKVLDFSRVIAGPYAGRLLAEYGADVLQVSFRKGHILWEEPFLVAFSGGKDSITADLSSAEGKKAFQKIVNDFKPDIVLHNFSEATVQKLAIDEQSFKNINPDVIYISIAAYNKQGPWRDRVGFEWNIQAATGVVAAYGGRKNPKILNIPINDLSTGLIACFGGALAWYNKLKGNGGNTVSAFLSTPSLYLLLDGFNPRKTPPKDICAFFRAQDDWFLFSVKERHFDKLLSLPALAGIKGVSYSQWHSWLQRTFKKQPCAYWKRVVQEAGFTKEIQVIKRIKVKKLLHEDLNREDPLFQYKRHHVFGEVLVVDSPVQMSQTPVKDICPAHYFGMDTEKYLDRTGIDSEELRKKLVVPVKPVKKVTSLQRMKWFLGQMKWLAAFVYKKS